MNNYYPYYQYQQPQMVQNPMIQQTVATQNGIAGKLVNDFSEITIRDIPTDCTPAFFVKGDLTEIQARKWTDAGQVVPIIYKRVDAVESKPDPFEEIFKRLDVIENKLDNKRVVKKNENET